jgi:hypothetical protein
MFDAGSLRWAEVEPSTHPFDPALARTCAASVIDDALAAFAARGGRPETATKDDEHALTGDERDALERACERALVGAYGAWVCGWCWAANEPGGGGLVHGWCCARDSVLPVLGRRGDHGPYVLEDGGKTVDRVVAAVAEWRVALEELARMYRSLPLLPGHEAQGAETAAARLLDHVAERTGANDAWRHTLATVLRWFAESKGRDTTSAARIASAAVSDRFGSWCAPDEVSAAAMVADFARGMLERPVAPLARDGTAQWQARRASYGAVRDTITAAEQAPVSGDGHLRFIQGLERARDPLRADRMAAALACARAWAASTRPLTFAELQRWQKEVLGVPSAPFRSSDAFAKEGGERYPVLGAREAFERCLAEADEPDLPPVARAARAYLDVCFFHPFVDGNGRAARLVLDAVLSRAELGLHAIDPLILARAADSEALDRFAYLVAWASGPRLASPL